MSYPILTESLPIMEAFYTLQGEGFHQGRAAYFIRLGGCDVGCVWCDVKESWDASLHPAQSVEQIVTDALAHEGRLAVITGGEPAMYNLTALTDALKQQGFETNIETSGVYQLTGTWDWVCFSPKKFKEPHPSVYAQANELKVVIYHKSDLAWAAEHAKQISPHCRLYLQPEWSKAAQLLPLIIDYIKENPQWRMSLQVHKYLNIP
jgi:7-carboxy-7-deazaguanine synthase